MNKVGIMGCQGVFFGDPVTAENVEAMMGSNTGNLLFWNATRHLFSNDYEYLGYGKSLKYDIIVKPAANHLSPKILSPILVDYLEQLDIPILILGIGGQVNISENLESVAENFLTHEHCSRFIDILNKKCVGIASRGPSSTKLLRLVGYEGMLTTTGCPSQTLNPNPNLGKVLEEKLKIIGSIQDLSKIAVVHNLASQWDKHLTGIDQHIEKLFERNHIVRVQQSGGVENFKSYLDTYSTNLSVMHKQHDFFQTRSEIMLFCNLESWASQIGRCDISIGTRIHGNILASQLGIPSLTIAHDERVAELCSQMGLPYILEDEFIEINDLSSLRERFKVDSALYDNCRQHNCKAFRDLIVFSDLKPSEKLDVLSGYNKV